MPPVKVVASWCAQNTQLLPVYIAQLGTDVADCVEEIIITDSNSRSRSSRIRSKKQEARSKKQEAKTKKPKSQKAKKQKPKSQEAKKPKSKVNNQQ